ncbi:MAG TPA: hypothetical protein VMF06_10250 [Candidatus Limnocylindria bacterium]|jgi:flagellar motility protein MotE (MotC chaperone)|nr:hypothetical protein [Candidatus Limnocylindria bacterium]
MKLLKNPMVTSVIGGILYLLVTAMLIIKGVPPLRPKEAVDANDTTEDAAPATRHGKQIFDPRDAEADSLIKELQREKAAVNSRERELREWEARLRTEQMELTVVTQRVSRLRDDLDKEITRVKEDEAVNVKRLAKMYGSMDPVAAANIFLQMDETSLVKIMMLMKDAETAPVLDALSRQGDIGAKRAAQLSERLRISQAIPKKPAS